MPTLAQMLQLFLFIMAGYILSKLKAIPDNAATVLSKLENNIFKAGCQLSVLSCSCYAWHLDY